MARIIIVIVRKRKPVPYHAEQIYDLVNHVRAYPDFLPWCAGSKVLSETDDEVCARLDIAKGGLKKSFSTRNLLYPHHMIEIRLIDGPFKHLEGFWRFQSQASGGCLIVFDLNFEWASPVLSGVLGPIFHSLSAGLVDAFAERAKAVYG